MAGNFDNILASVAVGGLKDGGNPVVESFPIPEDMAVGGGVALVGGKGTAGDGAENPIGGLKRVRAGDADNADAADGVRGGDGGDGIGLDGHGWAPFPVENRAAAGGRARSLQKSNFGGFSARKPLDRPDSTNYAKCGLVALNITQCGKLGGKCG